MNSCMRCGLKLQHNYLMPVFVTIHEKRERLIVCLKCKEILNKKESELAQADKPQAPKVNPKNAPTIDSARPKAAQAT